MATNKNRISQLLSGSASDLACVVDILDSMLEQNRSCCATSGDPAERTPVPFSKSAIKTEVLQKKTTNTVAEKFVDSTRGAVGDVLGNDGSENGVGNVSDISVLAMSCSKSAPQAQGNCDHNSVETAPTPAHASLLLTSGETVLSVIEPVSITESEANSSLVARRVSLLQHQKQKQQPQQQQRVLPASGCSRPLSGDSTTSSSSLSSGGGSLSRAQQLAWRRLDTVGAARVSGAGDPANSVASIGRHIWSVGDGSTSSEDTISQCSRVGNIVKSSSSGSGADSGLGSPLIGQHHHHHHHHIRLHHHLRHQLMADEKEAAGTVHSSSRSSPLDFCSSSEASVCLATDAVAGLTAAPLKPGSGHYLQHVLNELLTSETVYVNDLHEIIEGYMNYWNEHPPTVFTEDARKWLFNNIMDVFRCNSDFQLSLQLSGGDAARVAQMFVAHEHRFSVYIEYCTNYPRTVSVLTELMGSETTSAPFRSRQTALGHMLPLGSYLLKPVQRILKYHLLLQNMRRGLEKDGVDSTAAEIALQTMTRLASHINEMRRRHEHAVRVQEIQSLLYGWRGADLTTFGELVAEGMFRMYRAKTSRHLFLFDRMLLIAKRREDAALIYKTHILCSNLMLIESVPAEPLCFHVIPFDNPRRQYTLQARTKEQKRAWTLQLKRAILESYNAVIPYHARELVLKLGQQKDGSAEEVRRRTSRRQLIAPEYLERRHAVKPSSSFNQRLGLRVRARSSDSEHSEIQQQSGVGRFARFGSNSFSSGCPVSELRRESVDRRVSAPSSPTPLPSNRSTTTTTPDENQNAADTDAAPAENLESIVEQLVLQNLEFRRILERPRRPSRTRNGSSHDIAIENDDDEDDGDGGRIGAQHQNTQPDVTDCGVPNQLHSDTRAGRDCAALSVEQYQDRQYVSFSDYDQAASQLTQPRFAGGGGEPRPSLHRTVSEPCRRVVRSVSRLQCHLAAAGGGGGGDFSQLLASLRRRTSLKRAASSRRHIQQQQQQQQQQQCPGSPHWSSVTCAAAGKPSVGRLPYFTPQLGKRAERLAGALRRSGSLGRAAASQDNHTPASPAHCRQHAGADMPEEAGGRESLAAASCGSSLVGSCDSLASPQLPQQQQQYCRIYGPAVSAVSLRQMVGSVRSRLSRLGKHAHQQQQQHANIAGYTDSSYDLSGDGISGVGGCEVRHKCALSDSQQPLQRSQHRSRLLHALARSLKERIGTLVPDDPDMSGDIQLSTATVDGSEAAAAAAAAAVIACSRRPHSTVSESTSCGSTSTCTSSASSGSSGSGIGAESGFSSRTSCDGDATGGLLYGRPMGTDSRLTPAVSVPVNGELAWQTPALSVVDGRQRCRDAGTRDIVSTSATLGKPCRNKSIRERLRSFQQSAGSGKNVVASPSPVVCVVPDAAVSSMVGERRRRLEQWRTVGSCGSGVARADDDGETSSQHSTSTQNTVVDRRDASPARATPTGWVRQVIGRLQGDAVY